MLGQPKSSYNSVAMNIRQVQPNPAAKQGLPDGDRLFHFFAESSKGKAEYVVAVHQASEVAFARPVSA
jgi:hypothetical protein